MKLIFVAFLAIGLCFAQTFVHAQTLKGRIAGQVIDENGHSIEDATVSLLRFTDSLAIKYELTNANGGFNFQGIQAGSYRIGLSFTGKQAYESPRIDLNAHDFSVTLPVITMRGDGRQLQEVTVASKKRFLEQEIDRTVVNVDALISNAGTTALDVLEKSPGVNVSEGGAISLHGKAGVAIYIDDKPSYLAGADLQNYLRSMPSSLLSQIELMTNPPAKYDAAGTAGIINIKTKKSKVQGFNLGMNLSVRQSRYTETNNSMDFNYRKNKVNIFGTLAYTLRNSFNDVDINREYFYNVGQRSGSFQQNSFIRRRGDGYKATLGLDFFRSEQTTLGVLFTGLLRSPENQNDSRGELFNASGRPDSSLRSLNQESGKFKNGTVNLNYKHAFKKDGPEIMANLDYLGFATNNDQVFLNENYTAAGVQTSTDQLIGSLPASIQIYSAKVDYSQPLAIGWKLEAGLKSSYTNTDNQTNYTNMVAGVAVPDYDKTNHFLYKETNNAAYLNLTRDFRRLSVQAGIRMEHTGSDGHQLGNDVKPDSTFNRNYTSLFPTVYLLYKLDTAGNHQLKLTYGRRIDRPYYQDLNPFLSPLDKYTYYTGNPYLRPSYSGNYEFAYVYKDRITVTMNYMDISDRVTETIEIRKGYYFDKPGNIGKTKIYDLNVDAGFDPATWFSLQLSADVWQIRQKSEFYTGTLANQSISYSGQALLQFKLNKGWTLQTDGKYQARQTDAQFLIAARGRLNAAISKTLSPSATLKLSVSDLLNTNINKGDIRNLYQTQANFRTLSDSRAALMSLSMRFGKSVVGQRKHRETGAAEESDRVKN